MSGKYGGAPPHCGSAPFDIKKKHAIVICTRMIILEMTILKVFGGFSDARAFFLILNGQFLRLSRAFYPIRACSCDKKPERKNRRGRTGGGQNPFQQNRTTGTAGPAGICKIGAGKPVGVAFLPGGWPEKRLKKGGSTWEALRKKMGKSGEIQYSADSMTPPPRHSSPR